MSRLPLEGVEDAAGSCSLVAWERLCLPIEHGGLGIRSLRLMGIALRTRWIELPINEIEKKCRGFLWKGLRMPLDRAV
uniref:Reverse transcriptase zinc-binding domain-containing protein n=1 Tax=Oryza meridionalis TaxID=40149 RepID=A0A0E0E4A3_9ORYZ